MPSRYQRLRQDSFKDNAYNIQIKGQNVESAHTTKVLHSGHSTRQQDTTNSQREKVLRLEKQKSNPVNKDRKYKSSDANAVMVSGPCQDNQVEAKTMGLSIDPARASVINTNTELSSVDLNRIYKSNNQVSPTQDIRMALEKYSVRVSQEKKN